MEEKKREDLLYEDDEIDLYELWLKLRKRWKLIFGTFFIFTVGAFVFAFLMTPVYRTEARILPVHSSQGSSMLIMAQEFLGISPGGENVAGKVEALLRSRTIKERVIEELNLTEKLLENAPKNRNPRLVAAEILGKIVSVTKNRKTSVITLSVEHSDPQLAKEIAESYLRNLEKLLEEKALTIARKNREFLERELMEVERKLMQAMRDMAEFQRRAKVVIPEEQIKGSLSAYSKLLEKKVSLQMELRRLENVLSPESSQVKALRKQLMEIENQLRRIENSEGGIAPLPSLDIAPHLLADYTRIYTRVKTLRTKYETLLKLYERARLEEKKENIFVEVIDPPYLPDVPVKPKKKLMVTVAGVSGLFIGIFMALFLEWLGEVRKRHQASDLKN